MQAAIHKEMNTAMLLITEGADVHRSDRNGVVPVHVAASTGNLALLRLLHSAGANLEEPDHQGMTVAHYAAQSDNPEIIDFLITSDLSLNTPSQLKKKSTRNKPLPQGTTPLHLACQKGNESMIRKLIQKGGNVEAQNERELSPLAYAAQSKSKQTVRLFREYRVIKNSQQRIEAIQMALVMDSVASLKEFYREDTSVNAPLDLRGKTPLHYAALYGAHHCAIFLIQQGAEIDKSDLDHTTPLDLAIQRRHLRLVRYLIQELGEIDLDAEDIERKPYLHQACEAGAVELAALLIEHGATLEKVDFQGMRPIHIAAKQANYPLLALLLAFGAESDAKTADGLSVQDLQPSLEAHRLIEKYRHEKGSLIHRAVALNDETHSPFSAK